jgi:hypothetical protein
MQENFSVKADHELWAKLEMDGERYKSYRPFEQHVGTDRTARETGVQWRSRS